MRATTLSFVSEEEPFAAAGDLGAFYIFVIITDGKHSKAIVRIAPTYLPLLVETSLIYTFLPMWHASVSIFAYVAPSPLVPTHANVDRNVKRLKHPCHLLLSPLLSSFF
jgi:hypothetical protein